MTERKRAQFIFEKLKKTYPKPGPFVAWSNPLELLIATVLSARATDVQINKVTRRLFRRYRTANDYARAPLRELERALYSTGFYRSKARYVKGIGRILVRKFHARVPRSLKNLLTLPGVSYKTAYLVLGKAFGIMSGIAVDTHVARVAPRLGLTRQNDPRKIGSDLETLYRPDQYLQLNELFIMHGRALCGSRPRCPQCPVRSVCPSAALFHTEFSARKKR